MPHIGASEAKTNLYRLLRRVEAGEQFVITKRGRPVAELPSFRPGDPDRFRLQSTNRRHSGGCIVSIASRFAT